MNNFVDGILSEHTAMEEELNNKRETLNKLKNSGKDFNYLQGYCDALERWINYFGHIITTSITEGEISL